MDNTRIAPELPPYKRIPRQRNTVLKGGDDRTEAQARAALHAHILCWFRRRNVPDSYTPVKPVPRVVPGHEPRQRPADQTVAPLDDPHEDNCYHQVHMARVNAELVRPNVGGEKFGGFDHVEKLRVAFLARAVQTRLPRSQCCSPRALALWNFALVHLFAFATWG